MAANSFRIRLLEDVESITEIPAGMSLYLFGSSLVDPSRARDVDILLVYPDGDIWGAHELADKLRAVDVIPPYEVLALSRSEEHETGFIHGENAIRLWPQPDLG
jgi:hypothetical protein